MKVTEVVSTTEMKQRFDMAKLQTRIDDQDKLIASQAAEIRQLKKSVMGLSDSFRKLVLKLGEKR
jgi:hypothetical protein